MNSVLQRFLISQRIWMLVGICLIGIGTLATIAVTKARGQYLELKKTEYIKLTESAIKVITYFHSAYEKGEMSRIEARNAAKAAINTMALDGRNYYYIYNASHDLLTAHPFLVPTAVFPDNTEEEIQHSVKASLKSQDEAGDLRGWDHPTYSAFQIAKRTHPESYTGFIEYYFYLWGEQKTPIVQFIDEDDVPDFAERKMAYVSYFEPWDWVVFSGVYLADEQIAFYDWLKSMIILSSVILAIIFALAWGISRSISLPLSNVVQLMDDISQGTGDLTKRLNVSGNNELSRLSKSFNIFVEKIAGIVQRVGTTNQNIVKLSQQISGVMDATVSRSESQLAETEMLASASNELSYSVKSVAERAQESSDAAKSTEEASNQAQQSMSKNISSVHKLSEALLNTQQHVTNMETYSNKVSSVLEVIVGIAEQTNLLALNAAIEAARAGEQGRGFAVVADEVRTLAQRTQSSTSEIHDIIESLQSGTSEVVQAVRDGISMSEACVGTSSQASEVLQQVMQYVEKITQMNIEIASAVDEQSKVTQEIAASSQTIADSSKDNLEAAKTNMRASLEMNNDTEAMDALVQQFKT